LGFEAISISRAARV